MRDQFLHQSENVISYFSGNVIGLHRGERAYVSAETEKVLLGEVSFLLPLYLIPDSNTYCVCAAKFCSNFTVSSSFHLPHISL